MMALCARNVLVFATLYALLAALLAGTADAKSKCVKRSVPHKKLAAKTRVYESGYSSHGDESFADVPSNSTKNNPQTQQHAAPSTTVLRNGYKHGLAGGQSLKYFQEYIGFWADWAPEPLSDIKTSVPYMSMCWGLGKSGHDDDTKRFEAFKKVPPGKYKIVAGFNEPDFTGGGSSGPISAPEAAKAWEQWIAPHKHAGSVLLSPSCALQQNEKWMGPFLKAVTTQPDYINVHIFKDKAEKIKETLNHFRRYGKKMWITELACTNYENGQHKRCSQDETNDFLNGVVEILENDPDVFAYSWSDADNGESCKLTQGDDGGALTKTGQLLKAAYSRFGHNKRDLPNN